MLVSFDPSLKLTPKSLHDRKKPSWRRVTFKLVEEKGSATKGQGAFKIQSWVEGKLEGTVERFHLYTTIKPWRLVRLTMDSASLDGVRGYATPVSREHDIKELSVLEKMCKRALVHGLDGISAYVSKLKTLRRGDSRRFTGKSVGERPHMRRDRSNSFLDHKRTTHVGGSTLSAVAPPAPSYLAPPIPPKTISKTCVDEELKDPSPLQATNQKLADSQASLGIVLESNHLLLDTATNVDKNNNNNDNVSSKRSTGSGSDIDFKIFRNIMTSFATLKRTGMEHLKLETEQAGRMDSSNSDSFQVANKKLDYPERHSLADHIESVASSIVTQSAKELKLTVRAGINAL